MTRLLFVSPLCRLGLLGWMVLSTLPAAVPAHASPGAHGPNGEHLDAAPTVVAGASGEPRFESHSELFEIVGRLQAQALHFYVGRYASNEAVLDAVVEVELGANKARAAFDPASGAYALRDAALLAALQRPGNHSLLFTIRAGTDSDLLDGSLQVSAVAQAAPAAGLPRYALPAAGGAVALAALGALVFRARRSEVAA